MSKHELNTQFGPWRCYLCYFSSPFFICTKWSAKDIVRYCTIFQGLNFMFNQRNYYLVLNFSNCVIRIGLDQTGLTSLWSGLRLLEPDQIELAQLVCFIPFCLRKIFFNYLYYCWTNWTMTRRYHWFNLRTVTNKIASNWHIPSWSSPFVLWNLYTFSIISIWVECIFISRCKVDLPLFPPLKYTTSFPFHFKLWKISKYTKCIIRKVTERH